MDFHDSTEEAAFREKVRKFLKDELPEGLARKGGGGAMFGGGGRGRRGDGNYFQKLGPWLNKLNESGWIAPAWPKEYGGAGLTVIEQFILSQEMANRARRWPATRICASAETVAARSPVSALPKPSM